LDCNFREGAKEMNENIEDTALLLDPNVTKEMLEEKLSNAINRKAYEIYVIKGRRPGNELADWLEAEKQILIEFRKEYIHLYI